MKSLAGPAFALVRDRATGPNTAMAPGLGHTTLMGEPAFFAAFAELEIVMPALYLPWATAVLTSSGVPSLTAPLACRADRNGRP